MSDSILQHYLKWTSLHPDRQQRTARRSELTLSDADVAKEHAWTTFEIPGYALSKSSLLQRQQDQDGALSHFIHQPL